MFFGPGVSGDEFGNPLIFYCPLQAAQARLDALENDNDAGDALAGGWVWGVEVLVRYL